MIELNVVPGPAKSREDFIATHPPFSIALDGYVYGAPFLDVEGPRRNFNHHEEVDRSCMVATCEQVRRAVLLGLYDLFQVRGNRRAILWANDCDQDVCLATWILMNPDRANEPLVRQLTQIEDLLDSSSGTFPFDHDLDLFGKVRWVFEPYTRVRHRRRLIAADMRAAIDHVHRRIQRFISGHAKTIPLLGSYRRIGGEEWWLVEVERMNARERLIAAGVRAAVEVTTLLSERWAYSLWRRSEYITWFPLDEIITALNVAEGFSPNALNGWGGASTCGGSPRSRGSSLPPFAVETIVNRTIAQHQQRSLTRPPSTVSR